MGSLGAGCFEEPAHDVRACRTNVSTINNVTGKIRTYHDIIAVVSASVGVVFSRHCVQYYVDG